MWQGGGEGLPQGDIDSCLPATAVRPTPDRFGLSWRLSVPHPSHNTAPRFCGLRWSGRLAHVGSVVRDTRQNTPIVEDFWGVSGAIIHKTAASGKVLFVVSVECGARGINIEDLGAIPRQLRPRFAIGDYGLAAVFSSFACNRFAAQWIKQYKQKRPKRDNAHCGHLLYAGTSDIVSHLCRSLQCRLPEGIRTVRLVEQHCRTSGISARPPLCFHSSSSQPHPSLPPVAPMPRYPAIVGRAAIRVGDGRIPVPTVSGVIRSAINEHIERGGI